MNNNEIAKLKELKGFVGNVNTKKRFEEVLGKNAAAFTSSIVSAVQGNSALLKAEPGSVVAAAFIAASLKLPIDPNLGFSYIVPYGNKAQFQIGWKGFVQLAIRTGQYSNIHVSEVYSDELDYYNPVQGKIKFTPVDGWEERYQEKSTPCGYYATFDLVTGFSKEIYWPTAAVKKHALTFSKAYAYDQKDNKKACPWSTDFDSMAMKTVLKNLLSKFGFLSIEMQEAVTSDQKSDGEYSDNPSTGEIIEAQANTGDVIDVPSDPTPADSSPVEDGPGY